MVTKDIIKEQCILNICSIQLKIKSSCKVSYANNSKAQI